MFLEHIQYANNAILHNINTTTQKISFIKLDVPRTHTICNNALA